MTDWNKALGLDALDTPAESRYHTSESGTYWISYDDGKEQRDHLADAIRLIGRAVDDEGRNWRIIEWRDRYHATHRAALDMGDIGTPAGWRTLQSHGITIKAGRKKRERLADYLQGEGKNTRWQLAKTAGWHGGAYILPSGEVLGDAENLHYHGDTSQGADYQPRGSLADWHRATAASASPSAAPLPRHSCTCSTTKAAAFISTATARTAKPPPRCSPSPSGATPKG